MAALVVLLLTHAWGLVPLAAQGDGLGGALPAGPGAAPALTLPNLAPLAPYDVFVGPSDQPAGPVWSEVADVSPPGTPGAIEVSRPALRFTSTIQNRGTHPFELIGLPEIGKTAQNPSATRAYQCVRFGPLAVKGARRDCQATRPVGALEYHAEHRHMHIQGFGRYELRRDVAGRPDMSPAGRVAASDKIGWCVSDMYRWRDSELLPGASVDPNLWTGAADLASYATGEGWYNECTDPLLHMGASWRQGISPAGPTPTPPSTSARRSRSPAWPTACTGSSSRSTPRTTRTS